MLDRRQGPINLMRQRDKFSAVSMSVRFSAHPRTARHEINGLSTLNLLERHHGWARLAPASDAPVCIKRTLRNAGGNRVKHYIWISLKKSDLRRCRLLS
jgi:DeoR/GlpR family transcriptional regulator of sugar metabolism